MISMTVFDWFQREPPPPEVYVPRPTPETVEDDIAINAWGSSPEDRLKHSSSVAVLCTAQTMRQMDIVAEIDKWRRDCDADTFKTRCLQVAAYARPLSLAARMRIVAEVGGQDVLCCLRTDVPYVVTAYTLIHRKAMRWRYRKAKAWVLTPHTEEDRVYVAAMTKALKPWQRREILGKVSNDSAREYFELKTGVKIK
jgi:hypothetical protein